ncbi:MAG: ATP-binding protein [Candidatus Omnitrophica bacterium]|nr:ATP-binding protein [Candidatus Omnitrophota bacterium]
MFTEPAIGENFFGRKDVLELLNKRVLALKDGYRQNIALTGQSLSGKSSIILHFLNLIGEEGFLPIYVEVTKEPFVSFAQKYIATMLYNALRSRGIAVKMNVSFEELLVHARESLPRTYSAIKQVITSIDCEKYEEAYSGILGLTSILKGETGISCIVILDEFDNLEHLGVKNPFLSFGRVIMVQKDTMYIVTSSRNRAIKKILSEKLSLLFGNFEIIKVGSFDLQTSLAFIESKTSGFDVDNSVKRFLIAFTGGNPFYLDNLITYAKDESLNNLTSFIGEDSIARSVLRSVYKSNGPIHQYMLNYLLNLLDTDMREDCFNVLVSIARSENTQNRISRFIKKRQAETSKLLSRLLELGLVSKNGVYYSIDDELLGFWLARVYSRKKEILVDGPIDKETLFMEDITGFISEFSGESERDLGARITELFNQFSNDLVQIDSKNIRLPHFTKVECRPGEDSKPIIVASFNRNIWASQVYDKDVNENDIVDYIRNLKSLDHKIAHKIIIPLKGMDENAKLLAKELKISIWNRDTINMLLGIYGKMRIVAI